METQICLKCLETKPLTDFFYSKRNLGSGYATICLLCTQKAYERNKAVTAENMRKYQAFIFDQKKEKTAKSHLKPKPIRKTFPEPKPKYHGFIYLLVSDTGLYKIGRSKNIEARLGELNRTIPIGVRLLHAVMSNFYTRAELALHMKFAAERVKYEWFKLSESQVTWICSLKDFDIDKLLRNGL